MDAVKIFFDEGQSFDAKNIRSLRGLTGLYLIYNSDIEISYPFRASKLIYVGMSEKKTNSMGKRLQGHFEGISGNEGIFNYQKTNPLLFTYINFEMLRSTWSLRIEALESFFILNFVKNFGVYPICNNKSGYDIADVELPLKIEIDWDHFN